jgi:hypothetical protein
VLSSSANPSQFGQPLTFTATVTPLPDGGTVTFSVDSVQLGATVPVDTTGVATSAPVSSLTAGSHSVVATYSGDADFLGSAAPAVTQVVNAPPPGPNPPIVPAVERMTIAPTAFAAASSGPSAAARRSTGAKVTYTLNEAASVRFTVAAMRPGRRGSNGRCVKPTKKNRRARACTRLVTLRGSFTRSGQLGRNSFRFTGRLARRKLAPGRYKLIATPSAGGQAGNPTRASFRIVAAARS